MLNDERKTVDEAYSSACTASSLKMEAERRTPVDVLTASGLSPHLVGGQLLRLRTEYDSSERPRMARASQFAQGRNPKEASQAARDYNLHELGLLLGKLKSLPTARTMLSNQLTYWGTKDADTIAAAVLRWWLNPVCHECHGTKYEAVPGTGRLSARACKHCQGSGIEKVPHGQIGRRLANWVDVALMHSREGISKRLRNR